MRISIRDKKRGDDFTEDLEDLELEREDQILNDEIKDWEEGFEEGYFSDENLL